MSYDHRMNLMYELWSYHDNGFIIDELCYIISSMTFIMTPTATSQKAPSDDISGTKRDIIDPLASKQPGKNSE